MKERAGAVAFKGDPLTLLGGDLKVGDNAPGASLLGNDMTEVRLSDVFASHRACVIATVPSLDTPVCDVEARRFNSSAAALGDDVAILAISMDLPFAQARWCGAAGVEAVKTLSDHREAAFGMAYGVLIKELRLLARTVFVVDRKGVIQYVQIVDEITAEPDYEAALKAVRDMA
jgi:thiol peroxidase